MLLDEKVDSDFIDLISKRYDTKKKKQKKKKKKKSNLPKVVFKTLTDLSGLENKKRSKKFKNILRVDTFQPFTMTQKTLAFWN